MAAARFWVRKKGGRKMMTNPRHIDDLVQQVVFGATDLEKREGRESILNVASENGIFPESIQSFYEAAGEGLFTGLTVPAINIRGITYYVARAVFRAALKGNVGALIFEIARSEIGYTDQRPSEYTACVLAAALREAFEGPVFLQGDHFQVNAKKYASEPEKETDAIRSLVRESVEAGFLNIDIDASTLVNLEKNSLEEQQELNCQITADLTHFIRGIEPEGITISIGGEIGEVGKRNSTVEDLRVFMDGYSERIETDMIGISKISVQTGTSHGGVILPDGSIAEVKVDFETLANLSKAAREEFGLGGAVQHGASTLPDDAFDKFPEAGTLEVHLATGFQNIILDSPLFPGELLKTINGHLVKKYASEKKEDQTVEQFLYKTRKKSFGDFKKEMWKLPEKNLDGLREVLEERFSMLFGKLNVIDTKQLVAKYIKPEK
jgi:fructose/tagatose bisphosphate aldolase